MRRTVLSAVALACTAVLASTVPAFADEATPVPSKTRPPASRPPRGADQGPGNPRARHRRPDSPRRIAPEAGRPQVRAVPKGAPNTGVAEESSDSGVGAGLIGGGAAGVLVAGGAAVFVVRRRRATGA
ncbi:sortase-dependent protein [Streptomyces sp. FXJ1.4098]|nr:sortase-dependent protein [Streptomyces sp. FXJ1.4098]